ncbi:MAG: transcription elongation factor NusA [Candidatus Hadarchaeum sp.]|nr:transcription elongation factor NusA [Candidatus Hadarchaeum sp.]
MRAPICSVCLKSGILCQGCGNRLKEGKITQLDVDASRVLYEFSRKNLGLNAISFKRAVGAGDLIVLLVGQGEVKSVVGRGGKTIRELNERLQKKVRATEEGADLRKLARDILTPARVEGVNVLYSCGEEMYRVRVPRNDSKRLPASVETIQNLLTTLTNKSVKLVFE